MVLLDKDKIEWGPFWFIELWYRERSQKSETFLFLALRIEDGRHESGPGCAHKTNTREKGALAVLFEKRS